MRRTSRLHWPALGLGPLALVACVTASPDETGGTARFDTTPLAEDSGASCGDDGGVTGAGDAADTFTDLYNEYFGPTGAASCAGSGVCHGSASQAGAMASGYVCAPDANGCYQGMKAGGLISPGDTTTAPEDTFLWGTIRKCSGGGSMPKEPIYTFGGTALAQIHDWLAAGAPND